MTEAMRECALLAIPGVPQNPDTSMCLVPVVSTTVVAGVFATVGFGVKIA
jgi:hypothetical protein